MTAEKDSERYVCRQCMETAETIKLIAPYPLIIVVFVGLVLAVVMWGGVHVARLVWIHDRLWVWTLLALPIVVAIPIRSFIHRNVVGCGVFIHADREGRTHRHLTSWGTVPDGFDSWNDYFLAGHVVFKARVGGWFRTLQVDSLTRGDHWRLRAWNGMDVSLEDKFGIAIPARHVTLGRLLSIASFYDDIPQALDHLFEVDKQKDDLLKRLNVAESEVVLLGRGAVSLIQLLEQSKDTIGRSKHAQALRESLEYLLSKVDEKRVSSWQDRAKEGIAFEMMERIFKRNEKPAEKETPAPSSA